MEVYIIIAMILILIAILIKRNSRQSAITTGDNSPIQQIKNVTNQKANTIYNIDKMWGNIFSQKDKDTKDE